MTLDTNSSFTVGRFRLHNQVLVLEWDADSFRRCDVRFYNLVRIPLVVPQLLDDDLAVAVAFV